MAAYIAASFCACCGRHHNARAEALREAGTWLKNPAVRVRIARVARLSPMRCCVEPRDSLISRRALLSKVAANALALCFAGAGALLTNGQATRVDAMQVVSAEGSEAPSVAGSSASAAPSGIVVLPNGLRYSDFVQGNGAQPNWGNLLLIEYQTYVVKNGRDLKLVDTTEGRSPYFFHHGNGFQVQGMEEAVHTMRVGGFRRVIIPPHMSYSSSDLGPLPETAKQRKLMNEALNESQGLLVMDLRLLEVQVTEDPRGYYSDITDQAVIRRLLRHK